MICILYVSKGQIEIEVTKNEFTCITHPKEFKIKKHFNPHHTSTGKISQNKNVVQHNAQ